MPGHFPQGGHYFLCYADLSFAGVSTTVTFILILLFSEWCWISYGNYGHYQTPRGYPG